MNQIVVDARITGGIHLKPNVVWSDFGGIF